MNNDLISREALKKKFERLVDETIPYGGVAVNDMRELIDNAPTVEPEKVLFANVAFDTEKLKELTDEIVDRIKSGEIVLKDEKPQGEWIEVKPHQSDIEDGIDYREECSICHEPNRHYNFDENHDIRSATYYKTKFCPNCGADMIGGGEE